MITPAYIALLFSRHQPNGSASPSVSQHSHVVQVRLSRLTERLSFIDEGYHARVNKYQAMINLSVCDFRFSPKIEMSGDDRVAGHMTLGVSQLLCTW
jgi:hypothetical protein